MAHTVAELNQVTIPILRRPAAEPPTRRRAARWDIGTGDEGLTRHPLVGSVDCEGRDRIEPGAQK